MGKKKVSDYDKKLMQVKFRQCKYIMELSQGKFDNQASIRKRVPYSDLLAKLEPKWNAYKSKLVERETIKTEERKSDQTQVIMNSNVGNKNIMECLCGDELDQVYFTRMSNFLFGQLMLSEFTLTFFSFL